MEQQATFDYQECFKNIYYYLYSNGNSSRAERKVSENTKFILCKLMLEKKKKKEKRRRRRGYIMRCGHEERVSQ